MNSTHDQAESTVNVQLDRTECCASGMCASIAPQAFVIDPHGFAVVLNEAPRTPLDLLINAARSCPTMCISIHRDGSEIDLFS